MRIKKMTEKEIDIIIKKVDSNVRDAFKLLEKASMLSIDIDFYQLKNVVNIEKYKETINYIAQNLSYTGLTMNGLNDLYNVKYWGILDEIYLDNNNLSCIFDVLPDEFGSSADKYMWNDLKENFKKVRYESDNDQDIIDKIYEFYKSKTNEELTEKAEGFCRDYVKDKSDTGILSGKWWIEEGIAKIIENYWRLEIKKGDKESL